MPKLAATICAAVAVLVVAPSLPAAPVHDWSKSFAYRSVPHPRSVATDSAGNVVMVGSFEGSMRLGENMLISQGVGDNFLVKYDAAGNHLWSRQFGSHDWDFANAVAVDGAGNLLVFGSFRYTIDLGGGPLTSAGNQDIFVAKYDADGNHIWSRRFGNHQNQEGIAITADAGGSIAITGWFNGVLDFGGGPLTSGTQLDGYVAKFDADGNHLFSHSFGDAAFQRSDTVAIDAAGNVVIAGDFAGTVDFGAGPLTSAGSDDIFLASYSGTGDLRWAKQFGDAALQRAEDLALDSSGNAVLIGFFYGDVDFGGGPFTSVDIADGYVASFDGNGNHLWSLQYGGQLDQVPISIAIDQADNIMLTGFFEETINLGGGVLTSEGDHELFVAGLDVWGHHIWSRSFANVRYGFGSCVAADTNGNAIFTGGFLDQVDLGGGTFTSDLEENGFLAKFSDGNHVWSHALALPTGFGQATDLAVDSGGELVLVGYCQGSVDFGNGELNGGPQVDDVVLAKFVADGAPLWSRRFGDLASPQYGVGVAVDAAHNIVLTGSFSGSMDFGGAALSGGTDDIFLAKLDANANHVWSRQFGSALPLRVDDVAISKLGIIALVGALEGSVDFGGGVLAAVGSARDAFVACFDAAGNHIWSRSFGDGSEQWAHAVGFDAAGNVFFSGTMSGNVNFGGGVFQGAGGSDIFLASFDADGDYRWSRRYGDDQNQHPTDLAVDGAGNVVLTGYFQGTLNFGGGALTSAGGNDIFVASFSNAALPRWSRRFGGRFYEDGQAVAADESGNVVVTGTMQDAVDFGGGPLAGTGASSVFLTAFDSDGEYLWGERYEGQSDLAPTAVGIDETGDISLTGYSFQYMDFGGDRLGGTMFLAHFGDEQVPVRFANFQATLRQRAVELRWDVRSGGADERFTLYRRDAAQAARVPIASGNLRAAQPLYLDASVIPGQTYLYQLVIHTEDGAELESSQLSVSIPTLRTTLAQNSPNPFNPKTMIEYSLGERSAAALNIYDAAGKRVRALELGTQDPGAYRAEWDGKDDAGHELASGVYYYRLEGARGLLSRKMLLLR